MAETVLIAEDNALNRRLFVDVLTDLGYRVETAADGLAALERARDCDPALILLDLELPRLPGLEVARRLRAEPKFSATPIIAVSAFVSGREKLRAQRCGCTDYLPKPLRLETLISTVRGCLGNREEAVDRV